MITWNFGKITCIHRTSTRIKFEYIYIYIYFKNISGWKKKKKNPRIGALIWESNHDMFKEEEKHISYIFFQS